MAAQAHFSFWTKVAALLFLGVFIATNWSSYGLIHFLWFSNIGLIGAVLALWLENRMLASMMLLLTCMADGIGWNVDFLFGLLAGWHPLGATAYMFDPRIPLFARGVSLYHPLAPALLLWIVYKVRYDPRALAAQTLFGSLILSLSYALTDPASNINCVFGPGTQPQTYMPSWLYLAVVMAFIPLAFYLPVHLIMLRLGWNQVIEMAQEDS